MDSAANCFPLDEPTAEAPWDKTGRMPYVVRILGWGAVLALAVSYSFWYFVLLAVAIGGLVSMVFSSLLEGAIVFGIVVILAIPHWLLWRWVGHVRRWAVLPQGLPTSISEHLVCLPMVGYAWLEGPGFYRFDGNGLFVAARLRRDSNYVMQAISVVGAIPLFLPFYLILCIALVAFSVFQNAFRVLRDGVESNSPVKEDPCPMVVSEIRPEDIRSVRCYGPLVDLRLRFKALKTHGFDRVRLVVQSGHRSAFFAEFDVAFPGKLPRTYHTAVTADALP